LVKHYTTKTFQSQLVGHWVSVGFSTLFGYKYVEQGLKKCTQRMSHKSVWLTMPQVKCVGVVFICWGNFPPLAHYHSIFHFPCVMSVHIDLTCVWLALFFLLPQTYQWYFHLEALKC